MDIEILTLYINKSAWKENNENVACTLHEWFWSIRTDLPTMVNGKYSIVYIHAQIIIYKKNNYTLYNVGLKN